MPSRMALMMGSKGLKKKGISDKYLASKSMNFSWVMGSDYKFVFLLCKREDIYFDEETGAEEMGGAGK